ncbi:MAG: hypothetical protein ACBR12_08710 [Microcoleus sp.]
MMTYVRRKKKGRRKKSCFTPRFQALPGNADLEALPHGMEEEAEPLDLRY